MNDSSSAAAKPPLKPSPSQFGDDSLIESEKGKDLCEKTLIDVEATVGGFDTPFSETPTADSSDFDDSFVPETAFDDPMDGFVPDSEVGGFDSPFSETPAAASSDFDDSIVPETAFDDPMEGFVPDSEDEAVEEGAVTAEAATVTTEAVAVTAEEAAVKAEKEAQWRADVEEMIGLQIPAYLKLVRSFP